MNIWRCTFCCWRRYIICSYDVSVVSRFTCKLYFRIYIYSLKTSSGYRKRIYVWLTARLGKVEIFGGSKYISKKNKKRLSHLYISITQNRMQSTYWHQKMRRKRRKWGGLLDIYIRNDCYLEQVLVKLILICGQIKMISGALIYIYASMWMSNSEFTL